MSAFFDGRRSREAWSLLARESVPLRAVAVMSNDEGWTLPIAELDTSDHDDVNDLFDAYELARGTGPGQSHWAFFLGPDERAYALLRIDIGGEFAAGFHIMLDIEDCLPMLKDLARTGRLGLVRRSLEQANSTGVYPPAIMVEVATEYLGGVLHFRRQVIAAGMSLPEALKRASKLDLRELPEHVVKFESDWRN